MGAKCFHLCYCFLKNCLPSWPFGNIFPDCMTIFPYSSHYLNYAPKLPEGCLAKPAEA